MGSARMRIREFPCEASPSSEDCSTRLPEVTRHEDPTLGAALRASEFPARTETQCVTGDLARPDVPEAPERRASILLPGTREVPIL